MAQDVLPVSDEGAFHALWRSFAMIIFSEIGDKTFLIAAILAMRHPRLIVFAGAFGSLAVMSLLSAGLGHILPALIPRKWTQTCAAVLFLVFGAKMLQEGREMKAGNEKIQEEIKEAEEDIEGDEAVHDGTGLVGEDGEVVVPLEAVEAGHGNGHVRRRSNGGQPASPRSQTKHTMKTYAESTRNFFSYLLGPVFVQAFVLTFLGEWGDRSQISTIALAAADVSSCFALVLFLVSHLRPSRAELVCCCGGHDNRPLVLYCARCHGRALCIHENICEAWCVLRRPSPRSLGAIVLTPISHLRSNAGRKRAVPIVWHRVFV